MGGAAGHETTGPALPAVVKVLMFSGSIAVFVLNTTRNETWNKAIGAQGSYS